MYIWIKVIIICGSKEFYNRLSFFKIQTNQKYILFHLIPTVQLTFIPSPNIGPYQLTHYQCSVDHPNFYCLAC